MIVVTTFVAVFMIFIGMTDHELVGAGGKGIGSGPFKRIFLLEKLRIHFGGAIEIKTADVEHVIERDIAILRAMDLRERVHAVQTLLERIDLSWFYQISLVEQDHIGKRDLLLRFVFSVEMLENVFRVDDGHDGIETELSFHFVVGEECLCDGCGVRHAGGFDQDGVEFVLTLEQAAENANEVAAHGAADAAVVHLEDFLVTLDDELIVHADFAEFVFNHGDLFAVLLREDAVEEGGFTGTEKTGEDCDGNGIVGHR